MIKCKDAPSGCKMGGICCLYCVEKDSCGDCCDVMDANCKAAVEVDGSVALQEFQNTALVLSQKIADLHNQMTMLEVADAEVRKQLVDAMDKFGIKNWENDVLKVTYVEPTTRTTVDSKALKADLPAIYEKYSKTSQVKGSVRITVKG